MNLSREPNVQVNFQISFLDDKKYNPFFKKGSDLTYKFWGYSLDELISVPSNDFPGLRFEKNKIPGLTESLYQTILENKNDLFILKNNKILLILYSLSKIDDVVLFHVSNIWTEVCYESRETWESFYGLEARTCCKNNYFSIFEKSSEMKDSLVFDSFNPSNSDLDLKIEKNCIFKKPYIKCNSIVFSNFFNKENEIIAKKFDNNVFNIPIDSTFKLTPNGDQVKFCYGGLDNFSSLTCDLLYDKIIFKNTSQESCEYNFKNFISDSLHTCFYYQDTIQGVLPSKNEQKLLYLSIRIN